MEYKKLSECCISIADGDHMPPPKADTGIPFITISNVDGNNHIDFTNAMYVPKSYYDSLDDKRRAHKGDILYSVVGSFGIPILITDEVKFVFQRHIAILRANKKVILPEYLYYIMKSKAFYGMADAYAVGAAQRTISLTSLRNMKIAVPPIDIQEKMVSHLLDFDRLIDDNNNRIKLMEQMAENLFKEWFVRFRFPGWENAEFVVENPKGWILSTEQEMRRPKDWHYGEFSGLGSFVRGKNITVAEMIEGEVPVISAGLEPSGYHNQANVYGKSLTISASGANAGYLKYNLGNIWAADCSYYKNEDNLWFAYNTLKFLQSVISNLQCGAAQPHVHPKQINRLTVIIPSNELIQKFCSTVTPMYQQIEGLLKSNDNLIKQRDFLLPRLMSGKLEV